MLSDFDYQATKETTLFTGLRMMFHAKRIVQGVGGRTEAIALENRGATHYFGMAATQQVENLVINLEQFLAKFVYTMVSNISTDVVECPANLVPVDVRQTGMRGARNGTREEVCGGTDREFVAAD
jgi:hypothetical protein